MKSFCVYEKNCTCKAVLLYIRNSPSKEGGYINSFMSWVGGKKALRDEILARFPTEYNRYIEVFGGGGWVLFHKPIRNDFEVYNDFNANLSNLYRCVRDHPEELIKELTYTLTSRLDFEYIRKIMKEKAGLSM